MMTTAYITHPDCLLHVLGPEHPERHNRVSAIQDHLRHVDLFELIEYFDAIPATDTQLLRAHSAKYIASLVNGAPLTGLKYLDEDTAMNAHTLRAAQLAAGGACYATDIVMKNPDIPTAFVNVRPPGHHAERERAMGFCFFNNVAIAAKHALEAHGLSRVAIVDFDAHHGNGTEDIVSDDPRICYFSVFQHPFYPFTDLQHVSDTLIKVPLKAGSDGTHLRDAINTHCLPALHAFQPECLFISAGFDGHKDDALSELCYSEDDFFWVTDALVKVAAQSAKGRIVSVLEGGYALQPLTLSVEAHLRALMQLPSQESENHSR